MENYSDFETITLDATKPVSPIYTVLCAHGSQFIFSHVTIDCHRKDYVKVAEVAEFANPSASVSRQIYYFGTCSTCGKKYRFVARFV